MPAMDARNVTAIDVHTHVHRSVRADQAEAADGNEAMGAYFGIKDFENLDIKPEVRPLIMKENAARLLRLGGVSPETAARR